jgi:hypothetical protein
MFIWHKSVERDALKYCAVSRKRLIQQNDCQLSTHKYQHAHAGGIDIMMVALRSSLRQAIIKCLVEVGVLMFFLFTALSHKLLIYRTPEFGDRIVTYEKIFDVHKR